MVLWTLHVDRSSNIGDVEVGLILTSLDGIVVEYAFHFGFKTSNNKVEYEVLLVELRLIWELRVQCHQVINNSQLMISQVRGEYKTKAPSMKKYLQKV